MKGDGIRFHPCLPCFELPWSSLELAFSICLMPDPFGCLRFESFIDGVELEIYRPWGSMSGRMALGLGSGTRKFAGQEENYLLPNPQHAKPYFFPMTSFFLGKSAQPFLSEFPEPDAALLCHGTEPRQTPPKLKRSAMSGESGAAARGRQC